MLYLGADHRGYKLKKALKEFLETEGMAFEDLGAHEKILSDDYPDYARLAAEAVSKKPDEHRGILICGSGAGVCIAANKIKGIRAALATNPKMSKALRNDDDVNILCIASDFTGEAEAIKIVEAFLETPFGAEERYVRRINKIKELE